MADGTELVSITVGGSTHTRTAAEWLELARADLRGPVAWQWRKSGTPWSLERTFSSEVFSTAPGTEVRPLFAGRVTTYGVKGEGNG